MNKKDVDKSKLIMQYSNLLKKLISDLERLGINLDSDYTTIKRQLLTRRLY